MTKQRSNRLFSIPSIAWMMLAFTVVAFTGQIVLQTMGCGNLIDSSHPEPALAYGMWVLPMTSLAFALLGTLINTYQPANRFGLLANTFGFAMMWGALASAYGECGITGRVPLPRSEYAVWAARSVDMIAYLSLTMMPWLFPDSRFLSAKWRRVGLFGIILVLALTVLMAFWSDSLRVDPFGRYRIDNPLNLGHATTPWPVSIIQSTLDKMIMLFFFGGIVSLFLRWRQSDGEIRQQIKWLAFLFATAGTLFLAVEVIGNAFNPAIFDGWFYLIELTIFWLGMPAAIGLAVFKYRLYDIDIIIRRALLYGLLTGLLALIYFGSIVVLQALFHSVTGGNSPVVIVLSTLLIAALFTPLRRRVQNVIDRRFFRQKYDAQKVLATFAVTARDETDLDNLTRELQQVVAETMQPESAGVWLLGTEAIHGEQV